MGRGVGWGGGGGLFVAIWWTRWRIAVSLHGKRHLNQPIWNGSLRQFHQRHEILTKGLPVKGQLRSLPQKWYLVSFRGIFSLQLLDLRLKKTRLDFKLGNDKWPTSLLVVWVLPAGEKNKLIQAFQNKAIQNEVASSRAFVFLGASITLGLHCPNLCLKKTSVATCGRGVRDGIVLTGCKWEGCGYFKLLISQYLMRISTSIHLCKQQIFISSYCTSHGLFTLRSLFPTFLLRTQFPVYPCNHLPTTMAKGRHQQDIDLGNKEKPDYFLHPSLSVLSIIFLCGSSSPLDSPSSSVLGSPSHGIASTSDSGDTIPFLCPLGPCGGRSFLLSFISGHFIIPFSFSPFPISCVINFLF